jgi:hypothetical protein
MTLYQWTMLSILTARSRTVTLLSRDRQTPRLRHQPIVSPPLTRWWTSLLRKRGRLVSTNGKTSLGESYCGHSWTDTSRSCCVIVISLRRKKNISSYQNQTFRKWPRRSLALQTRIRLCVSMADLSFPPRIHMRRSLVSPYGCVVSIRLPNVIGRKLQQRPKIDTIVSKPRDPSIRM